MPFIGVCGEHQRMKTATYFHCQLKPISRSAGKSVVNCAAYRTGMKLEDEHYGTTRDYTQKKDVVTSFTLAPDGAPAWACDTESLWNAVEKKENRKNSILSYEFEVALPNELDDAHRENITRNIAGWLRDEYGVAVTAGIHSGGERGNGKNDHAHIFMTTREITEAGWAKNKLRDFNVRPGQDNPEVDRVRAQVAEFINGSLADNGSDERVTHESYRARGIDIEGTKHLGPAAAAIERTGESDRGRINRAIIEARLTWQMEVVQPEIDAAIATDLVNRFGDDPATAQPSAATDDTRIAPAADAPPSIPGDPQEAPRGTPADWVEAPQGTPADWIEAPQGTPDDWIEASRSQAGEAASRGTPQGWRFAPAGEGGDQRREHTAWEGFAGRVRSYWQRVSEFVHDVRGHSSDAPAPSQPEAQPDAQSDSKQSWVERVMHSKAVQAGRRLLHGWGHHDGKEFFDAAKDAAGVVEEIIAQGPKRAAAANAPDPQPDTVPSPELPPRPTLGTSAFDSFAASVDASKPSPRDRPVSAFDALTAQRTGQQPAPSPSAPELGSMTPEH